MGVHIINATIKIKKRIILKNITLHLENGKIYGLQGPNGSGKTMLMRLVAGLIHPAVGNVYIDNAKLGRDIDFPDSLGLLIERPAFLPNHSGYNNLKLLAQIKNIISEEYIIEALHSVGLDPNDCRIYKKYSLGMKQRLGIAAAIMEKPSIILLDEPFNALDEQAIKQICQVIKNERKRGALILLSAHDTSILDHLSDEVYFISDGCIQKK